MNKFQELGLLQAGSDLSEVLSLNVKDILERRLQSLVHRKNLARSMKQARQFIVHRHIIVNNKEITSPSYLLTMSEEAALGFKGKSSLASEDHPERAQPEPAVPEPAKESTETKEKGEVAPVVAKAADEESEKDIPVKEEAPSIEPTSSEPETPASVEEKAEEVKEEKAEEAKPEEPSNKEEKEE